MFLSVIIPAFNEAHRIGSTLKSALSFLSEQKYEYEILVVNDGSTDETVHIVAHIQKQAPAVKLLDNKTNRGKGWAVRQGMLESRGDIRLFMDADNSTSISQIAGFVPYFEEGYAVVIGSRRIAGAQIAQHQPLVRDFLGGIFRLIVRALVPLHVIDSQAGFKAFTAEAAIAIFERQTVFRWAFDVELLAIARRLQFKIKEIPIRWVNDLESKVKFWGMIGMLGELIKIRINLWRGRYQGI